MNLKHRNFLRKVPIGDDIVAYHCSHRRWGITVSEGDTKTEVDKVFDGHNCGEHIVSPIQM
jgi:predicted RNA-binding protein with PUA-like domain